MQYCPTCSAPLSGHESTCPACGSPLVLPNLPLGTPLASRRYLIGKMLGQGGFGITYLATDNTLGRAVAIKELFPEGATRQVTQLIPPTKLGSVGFYEAKTKFIEEARTLAQFNHPGIVRVFDVFEENGTAYMVMEMLQGETLGGKIQRLGKLPESEVSELVQKVGNALKEIHQRGLLHRDIKPDNIFLAQDNRVVLIDFGSARDYSQGQTVAHTRLITPGYAPLEQYGTAAKFGPYTDIYALAATLFHALSGSPPPSATDRINGKALPELSNVSSGLAKLITQSLSLKIDQRPQTVDQMLAMLVNKPSAGATRANRNPPPTPPKSVPRGRRNWANGCGCGCFTFIAVGIAITAIAHSSIAAILIGLILGLLVMLNVASLSLRRGP